MKNLSLYGTETDLVVLHSVVALLMADSIVDPIVAVLVVVEISALSLVASPWRMF